MRIIVGLAAAGFDLKEAIRAEVAPAATST